MKPSLDLYLVTQGDWLYQYRSATIDLLPEFALCILDVHSSFSFSRILLLRSTNIHKEEVRFNLTDLNLTGK